VVGRSAHGRRDGKIGGFKSLANVVIEDIAIITALVSLFKVEDAGQVELAVLKMLAKADRASGDGALIILVLANETADLRVNSLAMAGTLGQRRHKMTLSDELPSETVQVLLNSCSRRARMQAMSNGIPRNGNLVASTLILQVEEKLLRHTRT
jgi:hypothetical protein